MSGLAAFRLVLAGPRTPGNVGAAARVAANFGCRDWVIADARCSWLNWDARKLATGAARGYLDGARSVATLREAVGDCAMAVGFTRRRGKSRKPTIEVGALAALAGRGHEAGAQGAGGARIALVFGNEETGLSRAELGCCTHLCQIPTSAEAPSMNLSHAVAVVLARVYADLEASGARRATDAPSPAKLSELEAMLGHWRELLGDIGMTTAGNPERMTETLRKLFARAGISAREIRALRGLLSKAQVKLGVRARGRRVG